jgi:long-subunit acyl-CoA synthetase (AMP-forming)
MLDLAKYQSIGAALKDALETFAGEVCLIEAYREREKERLTYREFALRGHPLARTLQDAGFAAGARAAIVMTNQSKWLISAYAIFFRGGVLVPLDYKLTPDEQWQLLAHSGASVLVTEYPIWRQLVVSAGRAAATNLKSGHDRIFVGDGWAAEGLHDASRELSGAVCGADFVVSICAGVSVFEYFADESCD